MASIAYITDQQMIEFHRLNGNTKLNFWRPSSSNKKFTDFHKGDLLFFLAKGTERRKEKGIVGYGVFHHASQMKFEKMWKKYRTLNGYATKQELYEAIVKISKSKQMPDVLNCLELNQVVFFQSPIYLSDLGFSISNKLESYIYLDREHSLITSKLLEEADKVGVDVWSSMYQTEQVNRFREDGYMSTLQSVIDEIGGISYSRKEQSEIKQLFQTLNEIRILDDMCIELKPLQATIYIPLCASANYEKIKLTIGHCQLLYQRMNELESDWDNHIILISNHKEIKQIETCGMEIIQIKTEDGL